MNPDTRKLAILGAVLAIAILELSRSFYLSYRTPREDDWQTIAEALGENSWTVWPNQPWLDPHLRRFVPRTARPEIWGRPDIVGIKDFWVLSHRDRSDWGRHLRQDFAGENPPELIEFRQLDKFALSHYRRQHSATILAHPGAPDFPLSAKVGTKVCKAKADSNWQEPIQTAAHKAIEAPQSPGEEHLPVVAGMRLDCPKGGRLRQQLCEINYRPRFAWRLKAPNNDSTLLHASFRIPDNIDKQAQLRLRGHIGFHDFNARIRSDVALSLKISINGHLVTDSVVSDAQGWTLVDYPIDSSWLAAYGPQNQTIKLDIQLDQNAKGAWYGKNPNDNYNERLGPSPCFEFRLLQTLSPQDPNPAPKQDSKERP